MCMYGEGRVRDGIGILKSSMKTDYWILLWINSMRKAYLVLRGVEH